MNDWSPSAEETDDPLYADRRNFYKVETCSRDGLRVEPASFTQQATRFLWALSLPVAPRDARRA